MMNCMQSGPAGDQSANPPAVHKLSGLLRDLIELEPTDERDISGLSLDSRTTARGDLFLACQGAHAHGRDYLAAALEAGAVAAVYDSGTPETDAVQREQAPALKTLCDAAINQSKPPESGSAVPVLGMRNLSQHIGIIADRFFNHPSQQLQVIGVTGTNGKTSISHFLAQVLSHASSNFSPCGLIGTLGNGLFDALEPGTHTTPNALSLHAMLSGMLAKNARCVVMETSSHGLDQGRVNGVRFATAIFTNLSRDHLDYHPDLDHYGAAKARLFNMPGLQHAVINADDSFGRQLLSTLPASVRPVPYGLSPDSVRAGSLAVGAHNLHLVNSGLSMDICSTWGDGQLHSTLLGRFNASNLLATLATLLLMDIPLDFALTRLGTVQTPPGRMERFGPTAGRPLVVVDYAHTPDALAQTLAALREHMPREARLWCVFGCGGERDRGKRPLMGAAAERLADMVVVTDDNPRREDAALIVSEILAGMSKFSHAHVEHQRARAITCAITSAGPDDVVLIAGKGHEDYQQIGTQKFAYSDREYVTNLLNPAAHQAHP